MGLVGLMRDMMSQLFILALILRCDLSMWTFFLVVCLM